MDDPAAATRVPAHDPAPARDLVVALDRALVHGPAVEFPAALVPVADSQAEGRGPAGRGLGADSQVAAHDRARELGPVAAIDPTMAIFRHPAGVPVRELALALAVAWPVVARGPVRVRDPAVVVGPAVIWLAEAAPRKMI